MSREKEENTKVGEVYAVIMKPASRNHPADSW